MNIRRLFTSSKVLFLQAQLDGVRADFAARLALVQEAHARAVEQYEREIDRWIDVAGQERTDRRLAEDRLLQASGQKPVFDRARTEEPKRDRDPFAGLSPAQKAVMEDQINAEKIFAEVRGYVAEQTQQSEQSQ